MKKTAFKNLLYLLLCIFFLCGCTSSSQPQDIAKGFTYAFKDLDITKMNQYLVTPIDIDTENKINTLSNDIQNSELLDMASSILMDFTSEYSVEIIDEKNATITVTFNINNLKKIKEDHLELFIEAFKYFGDPVVYQEHVATAYLESSKKSARSVIKNCQYELSYIDNEWKIVNVDSALKSLIKFFINPVYTVI